MYYRQHGSFVESGRNVRITGKPEVSTSIDDFRAMHSLSDLAICRQLRMLYVSNAKILPLCECLGWEHSQTTPAGTCVAAVVASPICNN
jgi:hypothetical protein